MAEKTVHCRTTGTGHAKQFIALVGDVNGTIKKQLNEKLHRVEGEEDCFSIETYYYSAKFGIKEFIELSGITEEFKKNKTQMVCLFIAYTSLDHLKEADNVADKIKADMRVVVIESSEACPEAEKVEAFASRNEFEVVYLKPNEVQRSYAEELSEKVGIDRLIETIEVCNWPWRICNAFAKGNLSTVMQNVPTGDIEENIGADGVITDTVAELLMKSYQDWSRNGNEAKLPAPQHAERVHLSDSPSSPTTTEGTVNPEDSSTANPDDISTANPDDVSTANPDDVSISVDIDLVCTKSQDGNEIRSHEDYKEEIKALKETQSENEQR